MRVSDIMTSPAITVRPAEPLSNVIGLMLRHKLSGVPVVDDDGHLVGIVSEGDLLRRIELGTSKGESSWWSKIFITRSPAEAYRRANGRKVTDVMSENVVTLKSTDSLADAARLMDQFKVKRLPIMEDGKVVGMLTRADFMKSLSSFLSPAYEEAAVSDHEIVEHIEAEINYQKWAVACAITVACADGKVTLGGYVTGEDERKAAIVAAENVVGVQSVHDQMDVLVPVPISGF